MITGTKYHIYDTSVLQQMIVLPHEKQLQKVKGVFQEFPPILMRATEPTSNQDIFKIPVTSKVTSRLPKTIFFKSGSH